MMTIDRITSTRGLISGCCYDIIYRWEDVLSRIAGVDIVLDERLQRPVLRRFGTNAILRLISVLFPWLPNSLTSGENSLVFELDVWWDPGFNKRNMIPCIVDFWERSWLHLLYFRAAFRKCRAVLISSKEAYDFLKARKIQLPIFHWALSIPDDQVSDARLRSKKKFDMAICGRVNPVLMGYIERYAADHPGFSFLKKAWVDNRWAYVTLKGELVTFADTYDAYLKVLEQVKIGVYSTPGMDDARVSTHGFNQVTPRFLEYLAAGCHVVARYPMNSDVAYYDLPSICPSITSYGQFCSEVDRMLKDPVDADKYMRYLSRHTTSVRAAELQSILTRLG